MFDDIPKFYVTLKNQPIIARYFTTWQPNRHHHVYLAGRWTISWVTKRVSYTDRTSMELGWGSVALNFGYITRPWEHAIDTTAYNTDYLVIIEWFSTGNCKSGGVVPNGLFKQLFRAMIASS